MPTSTPYHLSSVFLLLAQYGGRAVVTLEEVCRDFFADQSPATLLRKVGRGEIALPIIRMGTSREAPRGIHLADLAAYIDERREVARRELEAMQRVETRGSVRL